MNLDFEDLLKKTMGLLVAKKKLASLVYVEKKSQGVEDFIVKYDYKSCIDSSPSYFITLSPISIYHLPNFKLAIFVQ